MSVALQAGRTVANRFVVFYLAKGSPTATCQCARIDTLFVEASLVQRTVLVNETLI